MNETVFNFYESEPVHIIPVEMQKLQELKSLLSKNPEIKFVSFAGIDLRGNDTDEKIPVNTFLENIEEFLSAGIQTDGSSVVIPGIASLNDARVDMVADGTVNWFVDYNYEHSDISSERPVGTLRIPSFLIHNGKKVDSRSILRKSIDYFKSEIEKLIKNHSFGDISSDDIVEIVPLAATELEFWVKTPNENAEFEELSVSQVLQEQYWKRTKSNVRTSLEKSLILLEKYGLEPEMGHKEVGGVTAKISEEGKLSHIMEQLEIDWKYSHAMQAADNELLARILIKETFRREGLEVTFMAKPMEGVAGSGEHTHLSVIARLKNGRTVNLFAPSDMNKDFLSPAGFGAIMGLLKNYEAVNPFVTSSNDAFNRLKPGFEAPVCIVSSLGHNVEVPSRNRTVLAGLVRDMNKPLSVRFEVRAPNPHTNTFLALAAMYQAMLDGIKYAVTSKKTSEELLKEFCKKAGKKSPYLEKDREYRSEEDVFEHYTREERENLFGKPPATVWENLCNLSKYPAKREVLSRGDVFDSKLLDSYVKAISLQWSLELGERIVIENIEEVRKCVKLHGKEGFNDYDEELWTEINGLRHYLVKSSLRDKSLFARIREALSDKNYDRVSELQLEMAEKIAELKKLYMTYKRNIIEI
jgi:glutamine synthetase